MISLIAVCPFCGKETEILVYADDYEKYMAGGLVQDCFPYLGATEREVIISGICPECQKGIFDEDEEEDE
jgi:hypothetical protein